MSVPTPQLGVLIMDDGGEFGEIACDRIGRMRPNSVRLAMTGAPEREGVRTAAVVTPQKFTLRTAVTTAAAEGLFMIVAPRHVQDPLTAFVDAARGSASVLDETHPGFAIAFMEPDNPLNRIAAVADLRDPVTTGLAAWAAVGIAITRYGGSVDVLVLGAQDTEVPADWQSGMEHFSIRGSSEALVRDAMERAEAHGVTLNWKPLGAPADKPAAILRAVAEGDYDLVIDDLPPISVGLRPGRRRRVEAALSDAGSSGTAYRLVKDAPCGVMVVIDAARLGVVSPDMARAGVATLALGAVGVGAMAGGTAKSAETAGTAAMPATADAVVAEVAEEVAPEPVAEVVEAVSQESMSVEQRLAHVQHQLHEAVAARDGAHAALAAQHAAHQQAVQDHQHATAAIEQLTPEAEAIGPKAEEAAKDARYKTIMTSGPLGLLPGGPSRDDARQAREDAGQIAERAEAVKAELGNWENAVEVANSQIHDLDQQIAASQETIAASEHAIAELTAQSADLAYQMNPVKVPVASGYSISTVFGQAGRHWSSGYHTGLDFAHHSGADVFAAKRGTVVENGWGGAYGNMIVIQHEDGLRTRYAHLSSSTVSVGQSVSAGERIGSVGSTGNSTGPHLHFELLGPDGGFRNPGAWLGI